MSESKAATEPSTTDTPSPPASGIFFFFLLLFFFSPYLLDRDLVELVFDEHLLALLSFYKYVVETK
jgi:hypothetical protein